MLTPIALIWYFCIKKIFCRFQSYYSS